MLFAYCRAREKRLLVGGQVRTVNHDVCSTTTTKIISSLENFEFEKKKTKKIATAFLHL
jgi:hypothetical protein